MAENIRKRKSKWDVVAEPHIPTEIGQVDARYVEVVDPLKEQELNSDWNSSQPETSDMRIDNSMLYKEGLEVSQCSNWSGFETVNTGVSKDCLGGLQTLKFSDMESGNIDGLERSSEEAGNVDGLERSNGEPVSGNQTTVDMSLSPKHPFVDAGEGDVSKSWQPEPISDNQTRPRDGSIADGRGNQSPGKDDTAVAAVGHQNTGNDEYMSQTLDHPGVESGDKDSPQRSQWELLTGNQTTANYGSITDGWGNQSTEKDVTDAGAWGAEDGWDADRRVTAGNSYKTSASPGIDARRRYGRSNSPRSGRSHRSRSWSRSTSRSRSRSRSRGRRRSWSRSRSPSHGLHRESQRWNDRGRMGTGGPPCRDFAQGRCRRGSECRYAHEDGGRKHFEGSRETRDSRYDRGRYSGYDSRGSFTDSRERRDYSRDRPSQRPWEKPELNRGNKSSERCFDFTRGRCQRGSECRYIHHDASSDGGRYLTDDVRERSRSIDVDASFGRRPESHRASRPLCKYFPEGRCSRGEKCNYSHEGRHGSLNVKLDYGMETGYSSSRTSQNLGDQTSILDQTDTSPWVSDKNNLRVDVGQSTLTEGTGQQPHSTEENKHHQPSGQRNVPAFTTPVTAENKSTQQHIGSRESGNKAANSGITPAKMEPISNPFVLAAVPGQNFVQGGPNQIVIGQPLQMQSFTPNVQPQHIVPSLPFSGQMQQAYPLPLHGQSQFVAPRGPPNNQAFNLGLQSQPMSTSTQQNFNFGGQIQQNPPNQQNYNLSGHPNFNNPAQVQHSLPVPYNGQNQQNANIRGQVQPVLHVPQGGQIQQIAPSVAPNVQNQFVPPHTGPNPQIFNSGVQGHQITSQHQATLNYPAQAGANQSIQNPGSTETKHPNLTAEPPVTTKVVTSEQAAQITNLSASLAQYFGNGPQLPQLYATLNPQLATGQPLLDPVTAAVPHVQPSQVPSSQQQPDPAKSEAGNIPPGFSSICVELKDPKLEGPETIKSLAPMPTVDETMDGNQGSHEPRQIEIELSGATSSKEVNASETGQSKKEQVAHSEEADTEEESKKGKDSKGNRLFKSALVDFVKDFLKPYWKEGNLSKEVHKIIVKKVVDKVTGAMPSVNIPQTQEKIDVYLAYSKVKLEKLVQAYLNKFV